MNYRSALKFASGAVNILLIVLTWRFLHGKFDWGFSFGCAIVSGAWLVLTRLKMGALLKTYFDTFSRLQVLLPTGVGVVLCVLGATAAGNTLLGLVHVAFLGTWGYIYLKYRAARKLYKEQGHGPMPKEAAINPPGEMMPAGTLILTSGRMATRLHESVGHGESVYTAEDGQQRSFSSYMEQGSVDNPLSAVTGAEQSHGFYVALFPKTPFTDAQIVLQRELIHVMLAQNAAWKVAQQARRDNLINSLPLPQAVKSRLSKKFVVTGYDWMGLFIGRRQADHWTCIAACLELFWRMGLPMRQYGTGLLGLGTGLLDPIMPARFLDDPEFVLITEAHVAAWRAQQKATS